MWCYRVLIHIGKHSTQRIGCVTIPFKALDLLTIYACRKANAHTMCMETREKSPFITKSAEANFSGNALRMLNPFTLFKSFVHEMVCLCICLLTYTASRPASSLLYGFALICSLQFETITFHATFHASCNSLGSFFPPGVSRSLSLSLSLRPFSTYKTF